MSKPMPSIRAALALLLALLGLAAATAPALAAPAPIALDRGFGSAGVVEGGVGVPGYREAAGLAVAPDGDVLVAGVGGESTALARYLPDGELDPGYGEAGVAPLPSIPAVSAQSIESVGGINDLAADAQGRALVLWRGASLTRVTTAGTVDPTFGADGTARLGSGHFTTMTVDAQGRILLAGYRYGMPEMVVARLGPEGSLDRSFGTQGVAEIRIGPARSTAGARQIAVGRSGSIFVAGFSHGRPALVRLLPSGALDRSFGHRGRVTAPRGIRGEATALAPGREGGASISCSCWRAGSRARTLPLLRFGPSGRFDRHHAAASLRRRARKALRPHFIAATAHETLLVGGGQGPVIRAYRPDGRPGPWLGDLPGMPRDRLFGVFAAMQRGRLLVAWTPKPRGDRAAGLRLERFTVR